MQFDQFDIVNYENWGELLKKWAEDRDSRPKDGPIEDLAAAANKAGVGMSFGERKYKTFKIIDAETTDEDLVIIVPKLQVIKDALKDLETNDYQLPKFYKDTFPDLPKIPKEGRKTFHAQRIGEYVMKWCG